MFAENKIPKLNRLYLHNYKSFEVNLGTKRKITPVRLLLCISAIINVDPTGSE